MLSSAIHGATRRSANQHDRRSGRLGRNATSPSTEFTALEARIVALERGRQIQFARIARMKRIDLLLGPRLP
jgi:hypothetical protein